MIVELQLTRVHVACIPQKRFKREGVRANGFHFTVSVDADFALGGLTSMRDPIEKLLGIGEGCQSQPRVPLPDAADFEQEFIRRRDILYKLRDGHASRG